MVDTTTAKWLAAAAHRPPEYEPSSPLPYLFDVQDATWSSVYLFGPVGRSFGAFIHRDRHAAKNYILTVTDAHGAPRSVDVCESLRRAGIDLARLQQRAPHPNHHSREAALQYLDFLLWLEAFLYFLLWHGFPSFLHSHLTSELLEYHKATFSAPSGLPAAATDKLRTADLWDRRRAHQAAHPGSHVPPGITVAVLASDWADPRAASCPEKACAVLDPKFGLMFKMSSGAGAGGVMTAKSNSTAGSSLPMLMPMSIPNDRKRKAEEEAGSPAVKRAATTRESCPMPADSRPTDVSAVTQPVGVSEPPPRADAAESTSTSTSALLKDMNTTTSEAPNANSLPTPTMQGTVTASGGDGRGHVVRMEVATGVFIPPWSGWGAGDLQRAGTNADADGGSGGGGGIPRSNSSSSSASTPSSASSLPLIREIVIPEYDPAAASSDGHRDTATARSSRKRARGEDGMSMSMPPPPLPLALASASTATSPPSSVSSSSRSSSSKGKGKGKATTTVKALRKSGSARPSTPPLPRADQIDAAPDAPRILGSGLVMSFTFDSPSSANGGRPFGKETRDGDVLALVDWFQFVDGEVKKHRGAGVDDFVWYLEEVLRRAEGGLSVSASSASFSAKSAAEDSEEPELGSDWDADVGGRSPFGLVLERVSDEPRAFGDGTVGGDGEDVCRFLGACARARAAGGARGEGVGNARRWVRYVRGVLERAREAL